jgi:anthranilate phosphoribosyltransferase
LEKVVQRQDLTAAEAEAAMEEVMSGEATPAQIAGFLVALRMKGETPCEIASFARAMRSHALHVPTACENVVDTCGTGGDAYDTFNISTAAAFVAAGAGVPVAKHGNRSVTSRCGSADILEAMGVCLSLTPAQIGRCIDQIGIGFMFAPALHPAMKHAIGPRRELRLRTVFNLLGPLTNPANARRQVLGVFDQRWVVPIAEALKDLGSEHALVVHGIGGLDEISTIGPTRIAELCSGEVQEYEVAPEDFGLERVAAGDIRGGDIEHSVQAMHAALGGESGPLKDIVALNAAAAIYVGGMAKDLQQGLELAREAIESGAAMEKLNQLVRLSRELAQEVDSA